METLPAEKSSSSSTSSSSSSSPVKIQSFMSLEQQNMFLDQELDQLPNGVDCGSLDNGLTYYVCCHPKPKMRAALALAVKVGSAVEEEEERGVAHMVQHLVFSATKMHTEKDIVKFRRSIGPVLWPCNNNAYTSFDDTVYQLLVPLDEPELLFEAISVLAEFSSEIRLSKDDLENEREAVMFEHRVRQRACRVKDSHWALMMEGSKYAERLPIGLEKVIQTVSSETLKRFYQKWYHPQNMAVIAVGDFAETKSVVELIRTHFGHKTSRPDLPSIPHFPVPSHEEPRFSSFVKPKSGFSVTIHYKMQAEQLKTIRDYRDMLVELMFATALDERFFKISERKNSPYFFCSADPVILVSRSKAFMMTSSCKEMGTSEALESMLLEVARVRLHGFSEREVSAISTLMLSSTESEDLEHDQVKLTDLMYEYVQHFIEGTPVIGTVYKDQLRKAILPDISASEVSKYAEKLWTSCSCDIKIVDEPRASTTIDDLKNVVMKINKLEEERSITPWDDEPIPENIFDSKPTSGYDPKMCDGAKKRHDVPEQSIKLEVERLSKKIQKLKKKLSHEKKVNRVFVFHVNGSKEASLPSEKSSSSSSLAKMQSFSSVAEEELERGVARIVEHHAFSATKKYTNHNIVKFLESIGAEFGPCHNAHTSFNETVYELFVPIDKPELLSEAILVLAEFSSECCWYFLLNCSMPNRLPIGLDKVIQTVSSETMKQFYQKWYHLQNMAVIAVGDFPETKSVVELMRTHFGDKTSKPDLPSISHFPVPSHKEPRFSYFVEPEASWFSVFISYKMQAGQTKTIKDYRDMLVESMFVTALNQRLFKIFKRKDPPYFSCSASTDKLVRQSKAYMMTSCCKEKGTLEALESMLLEVARVRLNGFSELEISVVRALLLSRIESAYLERDQMESTNLRYEYVQHFIHGTSVIGIEYEAQLQKTILPFESRASAKTSDLKNVVTKINKFEKERNITSWDDEDVPEEIVSSKPTAG
ncbi:hypothetical protein PTKIN_Ptkin03bG0238000 [Pterospermum kingtungense]